MTMALLVAVWGVGSFLGSVPDGWLVLVGTIVSTIGLRWYEKRSNKNAEARDEKRGYREEITELNSRLDKTESDVAAWRAKYFRSEEENASLRRVLISEGIDVPPKT